MNLFTIDLERDLTYHLVSQFLRINEPDHQRPQEGTLLDFNEAIPRDLGDIVTAFSNTYGGLIILGVQEKKYQQIAIPDNISGVPESKDAIKIKIINLILTTVQPRPTFSVGIVEAGATPHRYVAVLRVEEGQNTPYMFVGDQKNKISLRLGDSNRRASLQEIKELFERSMRGDHEMEETLTNLGDPYVMRGADRSGAFHKFIWVPLRPLKVRLDRQMEHTFLDLIRDCFPRDSGQSIETTQRATFTDFDGYNSEWNYHRKWRFSDRGAISFVSKIGYIPYAQFQESPKVEIDRVGEWIRDALSFINLIKKTASKQNYLGSGQFKHSMSCYFGETKVSISATMPTRRSDEYDNMKSIQIPTSIEVPPLPSERTYILNPFQLNESDIIETVSESFLYHIRHLKGQVDWTKLTDEIKHLMYL